MIDFEQVPGAPHRRSLPILETLNPPQRAAAEATAGPLIVLAGAGSGKTKMLTARIAQLIEGEGVPPYRILAVTFTNKAAHEMRERVARLLTHTGALGSPEIGTFHSVCVRILRREALLTPFTKPFVIYDDSDQLSLLKGIVQRLGIDEKVLNPKSVRSSIDRLKCDAIEPQEFEPATHNVYERHLKRVYEEYQKELFANNALDFGEILCMTYRILRDHPEVRSRYQERFRYIHVDEYQDTNRAQYLLLAQLADPRFGGHGNLCVVGDEDQSIYKWRGADIRNILEFERDYPGARIVKLEQNYRSTQTIISAASDLIRNNTERKDKTLWTDNEEGDRIVRAQLPDERAEAELVVSEIKRLAETESRSYDDFAIFYRTHAQSRQFEDVLRREKVPYRIVGGLRFYDRKEIKDVLSYFKVILNPEDSVSLKRIINTPARGIGKTTIEKVEALQYGRGLSFWGALNQATRDSSVVSGASARKLSSFVELMERLISIQPSKLVSELYHLILDETAYVRELRAEATPEALSRIENLEEFDTVLQEFEELAFDGKTDDQKAEIKPQLLLQFLEQSALQSEAERAQNEPLSSVQMMSLHSSKGLEFPVVFLVGMEEGLFPSVRAWEEPDPLEIEEERRLCYVGMTRARQRLYLTHVVVRRLWGNVTYQEPARFFQELPSSKVEFRDFTRTRVAAAPQLRAIPGGRSQDDFSDSPGLVGRKIRHPEYGLGTVIGVDGSGSSCKVQVEFAGRDRRKFLWKFLESLIQEQGF